MIRCFFIFKSLHTLSNNLKTTFVGITYLKISRTSFLSERIMAPSLFSPYETVFKTSLARFSSTLLLVFIFLFCMLVINLMSWFFNETLLSSFRTVMGANLKSTWRWLFGPFRPWLLDKEARWKLYVHCVVAFWLLSWHCLL